MTISGILNDDLQTLNNTMVVWEKGDDFIVGVGIIDQMAVQTTEDGAITVTRTMPNLDFITESENRLWGCRYGVAANGEVVNEIYACKLGDFKNWNCFMGLSTDSYAASCGTDGQFTGAITHLGYPLFFKEDCVHKVYGNFPSNYQIQTTVCRGVQKGSHNSLAIVNETLYYKSRNGICAYDGSLPVEMSYALGNEVYSDAVGGAHGNKYYVSMKDLSDEWHLFVYDAAKDLWHKEDSLRADTFCSCGNEMYCIEYETKDIVTLLGSGIESTEDVVWMAETGVLYLSYPDMKYISRMTVRMSLGIGAECSIYAKYDEDAEWVPLYSVTGTSLRSFPVSIRPRRCDHMRLRFEGVGAAKIYTVTNTIEQGSDVS